jgi:hypothetical protein
MAKQTFWALLVLCALSSVLVSCVPKHSATREDRLKWNLLTLTNGYQQFGGKNSKWDADAIQALTDLGRTRVASFDEALVLSDLAGDAAETAVSAGCDDPMVQYVKTRYGPAVKARPLGERQEAYRVAASNLQNSAYAPFQKFHANLAAAELIYVSRNTNVWPLVRQLRGDAVSDLNLAFQDPTLPESEAYTAAAALFELLQHNLYQLTNAYCQLETTLTGTGARPALAAMVKADFYLKYAWLARGHGWANQVTPEAWQLFRERLGEAENALNRGWSLNPYDAQIPTVMISICLGQEKPRPEMEKWFARAMQLDPDNYPAARAKLIYLLPQWYGSRDDLLAFGRQCVASTNWGGRVPLILADAHSQFASTLSGTDWQDYWAQPDVWPDIQASYERYAQCAPDATSFRYPYALYAFRCRQWQAFNDQLKIIRQNDPAINANYFGGAEAFSNMLAQASSH